MARGCRSTPSFGEGALLIALDGRSGVDHQVHDHVDGARSAVDRQEGS
jgi:hypothetical protein